MLTRVQVVEIQRLPVFLVLGVRVGSKCENTAAADEQNTTRKERSTTKTAENHKQKSVKKSEEEVT